MIRKGRIPFWMLIGKMFGTCEGKRRDPGGPGFGSGKFYRPVGIIKELLPAMISLVS